jgi:hypothetical protein
MRIHTLIQNRLEERSPEPALPQGSGVLANDPMAIFLRIERRIDQLTQENEELRRTNSSLQQKLINAYIKEHAAKISEMENFDQMSSMTMKTLHLEQNIQRLERVVACLDAPEAKRSGTLDKALVSNLSPPFTSLE